MNCINQNDNHVILVDNGQALRQPIVGSDINLVLDNIIRDPETKGQTYEIGGPHVYTLKELFEFFANNLQRRVTYSNYSYDDLMRIYLSPNCSWEKGAYWYLIRPDYLTKARTNNIITKKEGIKTIEDLNILPLSIHHYLTEVSNYTVEKVAPENARALSYEEIAADDEGH